MWQAAKKGRTAWGKFIVNRVLKETSGNQTRCGLEFLYRALVNSNLFCNKTMTRERFKTLEKRNETKYTKASPAGPRRTSCARHRWDATGTSLSHEPVVKKTGFLTRRFASRRWTYLRQEAKARRTGSCVIFKEKKSKSTSEITCL